MAEYNPIDDIKKIYGLKGDWQTADEQSQQDRKNRAKKALQSWLGNNVDSEYKVSNEDSLTGKFTVPESEVYTNQKNNAAEKAKAVYQSLKDNGYEAYANELQGMNYDQAGKYLDTLTKTLGKQEIRPYMYGLGSKYGMSQQQIDGLLDYDETTKEVSFGGKKIGVATNNVDGHTYWDADVLDNAFNDYINRTGKKTDDIRYSEGVDLATQRLNEQWEGMNSAYDDTRDMYKGVYNAYGLPENGDPFTTDWGQSMMASYALDGSRKSDNAIASGAADNSGNIDTFAAANARRARLTEENIGKMMVHNAIMDRLNGAKAVLADLGAYEDSHFNRQSGNIDRITQQNQQIFDNSETRKNNEVTRNAAIADITGQIPAEYQTSANPFYDSNGKLKNVNINYLELMNQYQAIINDPNATPEQKAAANEMYNFASQAKTDKTLNYGFEEYIGDLKPYSAETDTLTNRLENKQLDQSYEVSKMGYGLERYKTDKDSEDTRYQIDTAASEAEKDRQHEAFMKKLESKLSNEEKAYVYELERRAAANSDSSTTTNSDSSSTTETSTTPTLTAPQAVDALKRGEISQSIIDAYNYYYGTNYTTTNPPKVGSSNESKSWVENSLDEQEAAMTTDQKVERAFRDNGVTVSLNASTGQYSAEPADKALQALNKLGLSSGILATYKKKYDLG